MRRQAVIWQENNADVAEISDILRAQEFDVQSTTDILGVEPLLTIYQPDLLVFPMHAQVPDWSDWLDTVRVASQGMQLMATSSYPEPDTERALLQLGVDNLLRRPFTKARVNDALNALEIDRRISRSGRRRLWVPVRLKITLPYLVLTILFAAGFSFLLNQVVLEALAERFQDTLFVTGQQTVDWLAREETRLVAQEQRIIYTAGVRESMVSRDAETLRDILLPLAVSGEEEAIELLAPSGVSILSLRRNPGERVEEYAASRDDDRMLDWPIVQAVLADAEQNVQRHHTEIVPAPWGTYLYTAGPVLGDDNTLVGIILLGKSIGTISGAVLNETYAPVTIYDLQGNPLITSVTLADGTVATIPVIEPDDTVSLLSSQGGQTLLRTLDLTEEGYREVLTPWVVAGSRNIGLIGVALPQTSLSQTGQETLRQVLIFALVAVLIVGVVGIFLARRITEPLLEVVAASSEVAEGNLEVNVRPVGNDEVAVLAETFNDMVTGLREGSVYRDLLGRAVSPAVREEMRTSFASGNLNLQGQTAVATILISDIRDFTQIAEQTDPAQMLALLNEYFGELVPAITANEGIVNDYVGDLVMAVFGILPRPLEPDESAFLACHAGLAMLQIIDKINQLRRAEGVPIFRTGIGINTGLVTAGGLGAADRLHYTVIGDTVNIADRLQGLSREVDETSIFISEATVAALADRQHEFDLEKLGGKRLKGKSSEMSVYRLRPKSSANGARSR